MSDPDSEGAEIMGLSEAKMQASDSWGTFPGSEDVIQLNDNNFEKIISSKQNTLVMFHAPCKYNY